MKMTAAERWEDFWWHVRHLPHDIHYRWAHIAWSFGEIRRGGRLQWFTAGYGKTIFSFTDNFYGFSIAGVRFGCSVDSTWYHGEVSFGIVGFNKIAGVFINPCGT